MVVFYLREKRDEFNVVKHLIFPVAGALAFFFPLYYQFKDWPANPVGYGNWFAIVWMVLGFLVMLGFVIWRRSALDNADRVFVDDEAPATATAPAES